MLRARLKQLAAALTALGALGCSWDYPVWFKSKKSDTPLFRFVVNERYGAGYINRQGKIVIPPRFLTFGNHGGDFFNGLANVTTAEEGTIYIDASGKRALPSEAGLVEEFSEGLALHRIPGQKKDGFIDRNGRLAIPPTFDQARNFSDGLAAVRMGDRWGYIDRAGNLAIPPRFAQVGEFADGHALVIEDGPCQLYGHGPCEFTPFIVPVPRSGEFVNPSADLPARCRFSVIDHTGRVVFASPYVDAGSFSEDLAPVSDGKKWGYIDHSGKLRIPLQFDHAAPFSEGLASVALNRKIGFIDKTGAMVIAPQFSSAEDFSEGVAVVRDGQDRYSYINTKGQPAIPGTFDAASSFVMGLAHVRHGRDYYKSKWSYIDHSGRAIFTYSDQSGHRREQRR